MADVKVTTFLNEIIKIHGKSVFSIKVNSDSRKVEIYILDRCLSLSPEEWATIKHKIDDSISKLCRYIDV